MKQIEIRTEDGVCPAWEGGAGPSVLLFMDGIGMRPAIVAIAERIAASGYRVLAPDLFYRAGPYTAPDPVKLFSDPELREQFRAKLSALMRVDNVMRDAKTFLAHLPGKVGITGYCMGGRLALCVAAEFPDRIVAAAAFHPGIPTIDFATDRITARVLVAGASEDQSFPAQRASELDAALTCVHAVEIWPYKHGWVPADTPVHDPAGAARHDVALADLFRSTLT
ncbi:MAG: dienelactone hydrolase family protein [Kofleriaceae bacterium]